jgi:hypothetical protein
VNVVLVSNSIDAHAVIVLVGFDRIADAARGWPSATLAAGERYDSQTTEDHE